MVVSVGAADICLEPDASTFVLCQQVFKVLDKLRHDHTKFFLGASIHESLYYKARVVMQRQLPNVTTEERGIYSTDKQQCERRLSSPQRCATRLTGKQAVVMPLPGSSRRHGLQWGGPSTARIAQRSGSRRLAQPCTARNRSLHTYPDQSTIRSE